MKLYEITQPNALSKEQIKWLTAMKITYTISPHGLIDVNGNVYITNKKLTSIPVQFGHVGGYFICGNNNLTSLQGAPQSVGGNFGCSNNKLTSLQGAPQSIGGNFGCDNNNLTSLQGAPQSVGGYFDCSYNNLTSLQHAPQSVGGGFFCYNNNLTSLQHAPQSVGGDFNCYNNNLTSLHDIHKQIKSIKGKFVYDNDKIKSHILGLLLIKDLKKIDGIKEVKDIINKHLVDKDIHLCQEDLIQAGFAEFARL